MFLDPRTSTIRRFAKDRVARRLLSGPFAGMRYKGNACCSSLLPKVLGTYEKEIAPWTIDLLKHAEGAVVDVGCAEGYYAVGALYLNRRIEVIAFDSDHNARTTCMEIAQMNNVQSRLTLKEVCTPDSLMDVIRSAAAKVVIMDIEGGEGDILGEVGGSELLNVSFVVELHEAFRPGTREKIRRAFQDTHVLREVVSRQPAAADLDISFVRAISEGSASLTNRLLFERHGSMSWFIITPAREPNSATAYAHPGALNAQRTI